MRERERCVDVNEKWSNFWVEHVCVRMWVWVCACMLYRVRPTGVCVCACMCVRVHVWEVWGWVLLSGRSGNTKSARWCLLVLDKGNGL